MSAQAPAPTTTAIPRDVQQSIFSREEELTAISSYIWSNPELAYNEHKAHDRLTTYLEEQGFEVQRNYHLPTAFKASFGYVGTATKVFGLNSEYDALPGIGHACGHNLIAIGGVAAAIALKEAIQKGGVKGRVILLGTPAEEGGAGKVKLLRAGAYKDMDACMMLHPAGLPAGLKAAIGVTSAIQTIVAEFHGKSAHAAAAPWEGVNALDAAVIAYSSISAMRQQLRVTDRIHGIIEHGGDAPNVIPHYTKMKYYVRAAHVQALENLKSKVVPCFHCAAATATGCTVEITTDELTNDLRNCPTLASDYSSALKELYGIHVMTQTKPSELSGGSTDFGNVSYALPSCHPLVGIPFTPGQSNHTPGFTAHTNAAEAVTLTLQGAVAMALVGIKVLTEEGYAETAKRTWTETLEAVKKEI